MAGTQTSTRKITTASSKGLSPSASNAYITSSPAASKQMAKKSHRKINSTTQPFVPQNTQNEYISPYSANVVRPKTGGKRKIPTKQKDTETQNKIKNDIKSRIQDKYQDEHDGPAEISDPMEKLAERLYDNQKGVVGFGNAGAETSLLNSATQVLTDVDRIKNRRSLIARKSLIKQMDKEGETAEEKRERIRKMNEEAE